MLRFIVDQTFLDVVEFGRVGRQFVEASQDRRAIAAGMVEVLRGESRSQTSMIGPCILLVGSVDQLDQVGPAEPFGFAFTTAVDKDGVDQPAAMAGPVTAQPGH